MRLPTDPWYAHTCVTLSLCRLDPVTASRQVDVGEVMRSQLLDEVGLGYTFSYLLTLREGSSHIVKGPRGKELMSGRPNCQVRCLGSSPSPAELGDEVTVPAKSLNAACEKP